MLRIAIVAAFSLIASTALAAPDKKPLEPKCEPLAQMKAEGKDAKFTVLTPGQFHFLAGIYVASPITPPGGLPPGDGALLMEIGGHASVIWTRGDKQACITPIVFDQEHHAAYLPMPVTSEMLALLKTIKTGKDETVLTGKSDPDELHL